METAHLPARTVMCRAFEQRDASFDGVFITAVRTTGIFCRPTCSAKKPRRANVEFFATARAALLAGYRPCKRCHPLEPNGTAPGWLRELLTEVDAEPARRWRDADLRARGLAPERVRRWFNAQHGMTFHAYLRARRLGLALGRIQQGAPLSRSAYDHGFESESGFRDAFARILGDTPGRSRTRNVVLVTRFLTPLGPMIAAATERGLCLLEFADRRMLETQFKRLRLRLDCAIAPGDNVHLRSTATELGEYFSGRRREFTVPMVVVGSEFQRKVWQGLREIPFAQTRSYEELARRIGRHGAQRAVGRANGDNRLAILVPCHRVVRADGTLCGYGGGVWRKRWLLEHEVACARGEQIKPVLSRSR